MSVRPPRNKSTPTVGKGDWNKTRRCNTTSGTPNSPIGCSSQIAGRLGVPALDLLPIFRDHAQGSRAAVALGPRRPLDVGRRAPGRQISVRFSLHTRPCTYPGDELLRNPVAAVAKTERRLRQWDPAIPLWLSQEPRSSQFDHPRQLCPPTVQTPVARHLACHRDRFCDLSVFVDWHTTSAADWPPNANALQMVRVGDNTANRTRTRRLLSYRAFTATAVVAQNASEHCKTYRPAIRRRGRRRTCAIPLVELMRPRVSTT